MSNFAFRVSNLQKSYAGFTLNIPDLSLERGYILGLVGQNGAGKSTLIKILLNLIYPDSGGVEVLGMRHRDNEIAIKRRIGYVSENPEFYDDVNVEWMIRLVSQFYPTWSNTDCASYLKRFDLNPKKKVKELSKGMKVKLALLLALSHRPDLLILDEPTSGIDPIVRRELLEEIATVIRDEQRTVVFSSHITQDVEQIADYVAIVDRGMLLEYADKESLLNRYRQISGNFSGEPALLTGLLQNCKLSGTSFVGTTNDYTAELMSQLKSLGASNIKGTPLNIDGILLSLAGKEPGKCGF